MVKKINKWRTRVVSADFEKTGTLFSKTKTRSLKKHNEKDDQYLYVSSGRYPKKSIIKLTNEYNSNVDKKSTISRQTVLNILGNIGFFSQSFKKKLFLSKKNIRGRRQFYSKHKNFEFTD